LEGFLADGNEDDSVGPKAILGRSLDVLDDVAGFGEIDESLVRNS